LLNPKETLKDMHTTIFVNNLRNFEWIKTIKLMAGLLFFIDNKVYDDAAEC
jgi:hypothetical protein